MVLPLGQINVADILVEQTKVGAHRAMPIFPKCTAGVGVAFYHGHGVESGAMQAEGKTAAARE